MSCKNPTIRPFFLIIKSNGYGFLEIQIGATTMVPLADFDLGAFFVFVKDVYGVKFHSTPNEMDEQSDALRLIFIRQIRPHNAPVGICVGTMRHLTKKISSVQVLGNHLIGNIAIPKPLARFKGIQRRRIDDPTFVIGW